MIISHLDKVIRNVYSEELTYKELRKALAAAGCTFGPGAGHEKVYFGGKQTTIPRHGKDIGPYLYNKILRDLGLKGLKK